MRVYELIAALKEYPEEMVVVRSMCSDWEEVDSDQWSVRKAVLQRHYVMRVYDNQIPTMSAKNQANIVDVLDFGGN